MSRARMLLDTKRTIDRHQFSSDPEREEALLDWMAKALQALLEIQVDSEGPPIQTGEPPAPTAGQEPPLTQVQLDEQAKLWDGGSELIRGGPDAGQE